MSAKVVGVGIVAPGAPNEAALIELLAKPASGNGRVSVIGDESNLRLRRMPRIDRMAFAAAQQALGKIEPADVALVYGTAYGGLTATVDFLEGVAARGAEYGSPTAFHQSVHHASAGQISIALGIRGLSLTISSREISGEGALKIGLDLLRLHRADKVLVVAADEVAPALVAAYRAFGALSDSEGPMKSGQRGVVPGEGAAALLLVRDSEPGDCRARILDVAIASHAVPGLRLPKEAQSVGPLLRRASAIAAPSQVDAAAEGTNAETIEAQAIAGAMPEAQITHLTRHVGFNPSGGLLRTVGALANKPGATTLVHGLAFGGGQATVLVRNEA